MAKSKDVRALRELYRFPGFEPITRVEGLFGDRMAVVIQLKRREKKRRAACVVDLTAATTINGHAEYATCRAAIVGFTCRWRFVESHAKAAGK